MTLAGRILLAFETGFAALRKPYAALNSRDQKIRPQPRPKGF